MAIVKNKAVLGYQVIKELLKVVGHDRDDLATVKRVEIKADANDVIEVVITTLGNLDNIDKN